MSDKRSLATDALETLGTIIESGGRDAIHLAVEPTIAGERLYPGQHIGVDGTKHTPHVGIVDPFLTTSVEPGQRFWLVVYPRQINSLRHVWTHPAFGDEPLSTKSKELSEAWLKNFASKCGVSAYDYMLEQAVSRPDDMCFGEQTEYEEIPNEFWEHVEVVTGKKVPAGPRATYFRCAC